MLDALKKAPAIAPQLKFTAAYKKSVLQLEIFPYP